jgi:signal transduction histidine kinase
MASLSSFLRDRADDILSVWEGAARALPSAAGLDREHLIDFVPGLLDQIAHDVEELAEGRESSNSRAAAEKHARDRLDDGYTLQEVVTELAMLRDAIVGLHWGVDSEHDVLNRAIDQSILASVDEFSLARERALERSAARLRCLARAGALLSSTLEYQETLDHVAQLIVPEFADWCAVELLRADGTLGEPVAVAHVDPEQAKRIEPIEIGLRSTEPFLEGELLVVPLSSHGTTLGAMILPHARAPLSSTEDDRAFAEELGRRAASAIENARLYEERRREVELRDRILAVVSHDLRNPLGAIDLGAALLLKNTTVRSDPMARKQAETVQRAAGRMDRLISDLLDMSSIQAGRLSLHREKCPLAPILNEAADAHEPAAREKGIEIHRDFPVDERQIHCDHDRILQVLSNLLSNSIKFCRGGDTISLAAELQDGSVLISVADTGPGIEREELAQVFELYWKGKAKERRGTGLGLFISRGIVEAHGGRLWVESKVGTGSTFFLTLPLS